MNPRIYMDERERHEILAEMQNLPCELIIDTYEVADFIIAPGVGIERKRGDDFTTSLCYNRFFRQLYALSQRFPKPILLLENYPLMFARQIPANALYGALLYVTHKWNVCLIPTANSHDTAITLWSLAKNYQKDLDYEFIYSPIKVKVAPISYQAQVDFLEGFLQVSTKKAADLLAHFHTPRQVIEALLASSIKVTKAHKKKLVGPFAQIKGYGVKFVEKNRELLTYRSSIKPHSLKQKVLI